MTKFYLGNTLLGDGDIVDLELKVEDFTAVLERWRLEPRSVAIGSVQWQMVMSKWEWEQWMELVERAGLDATAIDAGPGRV